jgi:hypothetical protein
MPLPHPCLLSILLGGDAMQFRLRTLLIVLAILPPLVGVGWTRYETWRAEQAARERQRLAIRVWLLLDGTSMPPEALRPTPPARTPGDGSP